MIKERKIDTEGEKFKIKVLFQILLKAFDIFSARVKRFAEMQREEWGKISQWNVSLKKPYWQIEIKLKELI